MQSVQIKQTVSLFNNLKTKTMTEQLQVTRMVRKVKLTYARKHELKWVLTIRTDSEPDSENMEFFTVVDHISIDYFQLIRPGMFVTIRYYPHRVISKKGNTIIQADEIWINPKRRLRGAKKNTQQYYYKKDRHNHYYTFEDEMPSKSKNDEMYHFKRKWTQL